KYRCFTDIARCGTAWTKSAAEIVVVVVYRGVVGDLVAIFVQQWCLGIDVTHHALTDSERIPVLSVLERAPSIIFPDGGGEDVAPLLPVEEYIQRDASPREGVSQTRHKIRIRIANRSVGGGDDRFGSSWVY